MTSDLCPIWGTPAEVTVESNDGSTVDSSCAGGKYFLTGRAKATLENGRGEDFKIKLTNWLVEQRRLGSECPKISSEQLRNITNAKYLDVFGRAYGLLRCLNKSTNLIGQVTKFYALDNSQDPVIFHHLLAWTSSIKASEVITLAEYCARENWIEHRKTDRASGNGNATHELMLLPSGYQKLQELDGTDTNSSTAFVAMWFDASMETAYERGIKAGIEDAGYDAFRTDKEDHNNKIDDEIIAGIRRARFVVADFTQGTSGARGGVYYEASFAHGLNIPVIFCCRKDALDDVHFDTRQYNHIVWEDEDDLKCQLSQRICAPVGDGPNRKH